MPGLDKKFFTGIAQEELFIAPYTKLNIFKHKWFSGKFGLCPHASMFPGTDMAEILIVPFRFPGLGASINYFRVVFSELMFQSEMSTTRLLATQGVVAKHFTELEEIRDPSRFFKFLI